MLLLELQDSQEEPANIKGVQGNILVQSFSKEVRNPSYTVDNGGLPWSEAAIII